MNDEKKNQPEVVKVGNTILNMYAVISEVVLGAIFTRMGMKIITYLIEGNDSRFPNVYEPSELFYVLTIIVFVLLIANAVMTIKLHFKLKGENLSVLEVLMLFLNPQSKG